MKLTTKLKIITTFIGYNNIIINSVKNKQRKFLFLIDGRVHNFINVTYDPCPMC